MTPARTSATSNSRASGPDVVSAGDTTSATDRHRRPPSLMRTRATEDKPNQP
ncbi:hypothetical protein PICSAR164_00776 [Mycobacterium avium subsp. paratuberculosis]|nr:hypothetical protein PICSAR164_00776 [Mycobacterium avium subsp. paratuberculosis]CAG7261540.1 hypothetical protein PICSAR55_01588 [Mycobacterium avium subsp. paratuberculosis]CAG7413405.1 hypothetical protein PICSAR138_02501 [Mycobacterium avium subsp. paratuberculosis]